MDAKWWEYHGEEAQREFRGERIAPLAVEHARRVRFSAQKNSGAGAIALAAHFGARRVILLGYDCQPTGGKRHWHGDHPNGLGNAGSLPKWPGQFRDVRREFAALEIINCSRETALGVFPRRDLSEVLV